MVAKALEIKPSADRVKLNESIVRQSLAVGIARQGIADVLEAEVESLAMRRALGDIDIPIDFLAGLVAAELLVRTGKHVTDNS